MELGLQFNPITTEGTNVILQSAVNNEASQVYIMTSYDYKDSEVKRLKDIMCNRRRKMGL